jgi:predicted HTH domain antitoxin
MTTISVELPESVFSALREAPQTFVKEMRLTAAVKWYEMGKLSQGKAAEVAGLTRRECINALARYQVSPFQYTAAEMMQELADVQA